MVALWLQVVQYPSITTPRRANFTTSQALLSGMLRTSLTIGALVAVCTAMAQPNPYGCHYFRQGYHPHPVATAADRTQIEETIARSDTFDILHYDISLDLTDYAGQQLVGTTTVNFRALMPDQDHIRFDLFALTVDSVVGANGPLSYTYDGAFLRVALPAALAEGEEDSVTVHYHGEPHRDLEWGGFYFESNYMYNLGIGISSIPPNFGKVWYPCFDSFVERATYTYHVKSAGTYRLHGQGDFLGEVQLGGDTVIRSFHLPQAIPTHLSAVAVADYAQQEYVHPGVNGDIPVRLSAKPANLSAMGTRFVDLPAAIDACEHWYGAYPFDRVGYVLTTDGALEIPTNVAYPQFMTGQSVGSNRGLLAHELGHHWWGDIVTPYVHNDMWLKEGPAEYSGHLVEEWIGGSAAMMRTVKDNTLYILKQAHVNDDGFQPLSPMPDPHIYGTHTYYKGAAVMHNLRGYMGDEAFRQAMRDVQVQYAETAITAVGFKDALEAVSGQDLDPFFDAWVFAPGYAAFEVRNMASTQQGTDWTVDLTIGQKLYGTGQYHQTVPIDLTLFAADGTTHDERIMVGGEMSTATVTAPFQPVMAALNRYARLNQSRMDHEITIVPGVNFDNILPYVDFRLYGDVLVDSTFVRVDHMWSAPDQEPVAADIITMSNTHYWNVDGLWPEGTVLRGRLYYYGNGANQLDNALIAGNEAGLLVVYRPHPDSTWSVYADQVVNAGILTNGTGYITMNNLRKGQYAFAKSTAQVGISDLGDDATAPLRLHPVPTNGTLNISGEVRTATNVVLDVLAVDGRVVQREVRAVSGAFTTAVDLGQLRAGSYLLRATTTIGDVLGTERFELVR